MTFEKVDVEKINQVFQSALKLSKGCGLKGYSAIQSANDICVKHINVSPLEMCNVKLDLKSDNQLFDIMCDEAMRALNDAGEDGVRPCYMAKLKPWSKWSKSERLNVLNKLSKNGLVELAKVRYGKRGPGAEVWVSKSYL